MKTIPVKSLRDNPEGNLREVFEKLNRKMIDWLIKHGHIEPALAVTFISQYHDQAQKDVEGIFTNLIEKNDGLEDKLSEIRGSLLLGEKPRKSLLGGKESEDDKLSREAYEDNVAEERME